MKLSVYLLRDSVTDFEAVLQPKYLTGEAAFEQLHPTATLPFECRAYVQRNRAKPPRWLPFLASHYDTASLELLNCSNSFVLLVKASERLFAVTFGHGFQAIDRAKIEPRFGILVAASTLNPEQIRTLETNVIDTITRNRRTHISSGSRVSEFDLNPHVDWLRKLSGKPNSDALAKSVSGADSICIGAECTLDQLGAKCAELLVAFNSEEYKVAFQFLDNLRPIGKHEPVLPGLDADLVARLASRSHERISIAFPELPDEELLDYYKITGGRRAAELDELTLSGVYEFLNGMAATDLAQVFIVGIGGNGEAVTKRRSLLEYLVCEIDRDGDTYIFCLGHWFRAGRDYIARIRAEVAQIADLTDELDLLPIRNGESESAYNERLANENQWPLLDRQNFTADNARAKVEVCDLYSDARHLICVKKMEKSSTLSHLFAQGSVSATLLRESEQYRARLNAVAGEQWQSHEPIAPHNLGNMTVVYAIATRKVGDLASSLFFFSLVNLLNHARTIRLVGCQVAVCKVRYEDDAPGPRRARRRTSSRSASSGVRAAT